MRFYPVSSKEMGFDLQRVNLFLTCYIRSHVKGTPTCFGHYIWPSTGSAC